MSPLPRKLTLYGGADALMRNAHVHPYCVELWDRGRRARRDDTFIGVVNTEDWTLYLAPCFGVDPATVEKLDTALRARERELATGVKDEINKRLARGEIQEMATHVISTSSSVDPVSTSVAIADVERVYGRENMCYVPLDRVKHFDGLSHKALWRWLMEHQRIGRTLTWRRCLGWAIQRDRAGYYLRFASSLNEFEGQGIDSPMFTARSRPRLGREARDLPKQWALFFELVIARDLKLGLLTPTKFERVVAHGDDGKSSKITRFQPAGDAHLDVRHPGSIGTGDRLT
jgi:hypothetical protein